MTINNMKFLTDTHFATLLLFFFIELKPGNYGH